jgi:hypothetical protein
VNQEVLDGVVNNTFKTAYEYLINTARAAARQAHITMPIFTHGYDYPWPDGRGGYFLPWLEGRGSMTRSITRIIHITTPPT